jgi:hypothetical protein
LMLINVKIQAQTNNIKLHQGLFIFNDQFS